MLLISLSFRCLYWDNINYSSPHLFSRIFLSSLASKWQNKCRYNRYYYLRIVDILNNDSKHHLSFLLPEYFIALHLLSRPMCEVLLFQRFLLGLFWYDSFYPISQKPNMEFPPIAKYINSNYILTIGERTTEWVHGCSEPKSHAFYIITQCLPIVHLIMLVM